MLTISILFDNYKKDSAFLLILPSCDSSRKFSLIGKYFIAQSDVRPQIIFLAKANANLFSYCSLKCLIVLFLNYLCILINISQVSLSQKMNCNRICVITDI